ncbi:MAG: cupin domain-containing protein [Saprospiraceae bacterium]|nr:cupin domain-containing protein [Saprospiraceae bacterium]
MNPILSKYKTAETFVFPDEITLKILLSGDSTGGRLEIFEDIVEAGVGPPRHIHHEQDETFFFLEGEFIVEVGGEIFECQPGDVAFIPKGTIHAFKNVGDKPGRLRYVFSPALSMEAMFREMFKVIEERPLSHEEMSEIALKHGQEMVGHPL